MSPTERRRRRANGGHGLLFDVMGRVVGCSCGFRAAPGDGTRGDSVVTHLLDAGAARAAQPPEAGQ